MNKQQEKLEAVKEKAKAKNKAERYEAYHEEIKEKYPNLRFSHEHGAYYEYKDGYYQLVNTEELEIRILGDMYETFGGNRKLQNAKDKLALLKADPSFIIVENKDADILNVKNGLLSLKDFTLRKHTPEFVTFNQLPIPYNPKAKAPLWEKTVNEWMLGDSEQSSLLQQMSGYLLTEDTHTNKVFFLLGEGGNGKSVYTEVMTSVIGEDWVTDMPLNDLEEQWGAGALINKKVNFIDEVEGKYIETATIKRLSGGGFITANVKYKNPVTFKLITKLVFTCNEMPKRNDATASVDRRYVIIRFDADFTQNPNILLRDQLKEELPGIFKWCIEGLKQLKENKYRFPIAQKNLDAAREAKEESFSVAQFITDIEDQLEYEDNEETYTPFQRLFDLFGKFASDVRSGERLSRESFSVQFRQLLRSKKGWNIGRARKKINGKTERVFTSIRMKTEWQTVQVEVKDETSSTLF